jgi:hypothetical protein
VRDYKHQARINIIYLCGVQLLYILKNMRNLSLRGGLSLRWRSRATHGFGIYVGAGYRLINKIKI